MENSGSFLVGGANTAHDYFDIGRPVRIDQGGLFLCQSGDADIVIDLKQFHITRGDMVTAFPYTVVQLLRHSENFSGIMIGANIDFFGSIQITDKPSHYLYVKDNPCISLFDSEWEKIISLHDMLLHESANVDHPLRHEIDECLMKMIVYEIAAIYIKRKPIVAQPRSRRDTIFQHFIFSLFNNFHAHRSVEFYAFEQSITARHLSMVVKQISSMTAGEWIVSCTISNIKSRLQNRDLSIVEISDEFNFPNPSFFAQYFKKYTGVTPREYRRNVHSI